MLPTNALSILYEQIREPIVKFPKNKNCDYFVIKKLNLLQPSHIHIKPNLTKVSNLNSRVRALTNNTKKLTFES